jgi:hypothetical protein
MAPDVGGRHEAAADVGGKEHNQWTELGPRDRRIGAMQWGARNMIEGGEER